MQSSEAVVFVKRIITFLVIISLMLVMLPEGVIAQTLDPGYEATAAGDSHDGNLNDCDLEQWRFCRRNCTSYVAYMINKHAPELGFDNTYKLQNTGRDFWGNGADWGSAANLTGVPVLESPRPGTVAYYTGGNGHVAWVEAVNSNGTIVVSEYNGTNESFARRVSYASEFDGYIDFGVTSSVNKDLVFIKTSNTGSGKVEIHTASATNDYVAGISSATRFSSKENSNGVFITDDVDKDGKPDVVFIKYKNVGSGKVEYHTANSSKNYKSGISSATRFNVADRGNGTWTSLKGNLYFIKTRSTGSGAVEIHEAISTSSYKSGISSATSFKTSDRNNGVWTINDVDGDKKPDVVFVKNKNTGSSKVEFHSKTGKSAYKSGTSVSSRFSSGDALNGSWSTSKGDIIFAKYTNTGSGKVEYHSAVAPSYSSGTSTATKFNQSDASNGIFTVVNW